MAEYKERGSKVKCLSSKDQNTGTRSGGEIASSQGPGNNLGHVQNLYLVFRFLCLDRIFQHLGAL